MKTTTAQRPKRPRDINQLAALTLALVTGEDIAPNLKNKKAAPKLERPKKAKQIQPKSVVN
jgi:hypothetical protein